jgi:hypothetical protein
LAEKEENGFLVFVRRDDGIATEHEREDETRGTVSGRDSGRG